jgi:hypothetical protein
MKLENLLIGFLLLVLITIGGRVVAGDTQEALDVAAEKGLTDLSPSEPELGIVLAVCIFENADGTKKLVDHRHAVNMSHCLKEKRKAELEYKQKKIDGTAVGSFIFACDKVKAEIKVLDNGDWKIVKILGKHHEAYEKKKSYE